MGMVIWTENGSWIVGEYSESWFQGCIRKASRGSGFGKANKMFWEGPREGRNLGC